MFGEDRLLYACLGKTAKSGRPWLKWFSESSTHATHKLHATHKMCTFVAWGQVIWLDLGLESLDYAINLAGGIMTLIGQAWQERQNHPTWAIQKAPTPLPRWLCNTMQELQPLFRVHGLWVLAHPRSGNCAFWRIPMGRFCLPCHPHSTHSRCPPCSCTFLLDHGHPCHFFKSGQAKQSHIQGTDTWNEAKLPPILACVRATS